MALTPVAEALSAVLADAEPLGSETVPLAAAAGRVLAGPVAANRTQPPFDASAMDGYAVRSADLGTLPAILRVIGESAAGGSHDGTVGPGEAVRIFTGAPVPPGADAILVQEDTRPAGTGRIEAMAGVAPGRSVRHRGIDFAEGALLLPAGRIIDPAALGLAAAANHPALPVVRRPRVAILATGDELRLPGETPGPNEIIASNSFTLAAQVRDNGGEPIDLGIAPDRLDRIRTAIDAAIDAGADVLVTLGGASVGDHDLVRQALIEAGMTLDFWKIAMRPGKPMMTGRLGAMRVLGLPGNPVSSFVCARLFLAPLLRVLAGLPAPDGPVDAVLATPMKANDEREDYVRAEAWQADGRWHARPFPVQDSSMLTTLANASALIVRPPLAPAAAVGDPCRVLLLR